MLCLGTVANEEITIMTSSKRTDSPAKVDMVESFKDPLQELIDICGSITAPSQDDLKNMLEDYKVVVGGKLWYSIFAVKWRDFYNLPDLLKCISTKHSCKNPTLSGLCEEMLDDINNCQESIEEAVLSKPEQGNSSSKEIDESFYDDMTSIFHKRLKRICTQLKIYYLPKILTASHPLINNKEPQLPSKKELETILSERQLEIWNLLENICLSAKELGPKLHLAPEYIRKHIQGIRNCLNENAIKTKRSRGYWRPDAPPPDCMSSQN